MTYLTDTYITGSLKHVKECIEQLIEDYGDDAVLEVDSTGYEHLEVIVKWQREETDTEREKRLHQAHLRRERQKKIDIQKVTRERKEYERLKKKFEDKKKEDL